MNTHGRINPETLSAFLEGLPDLLEGLRAQGYGLGTRQHVAAHELVGSLFAHGGLPPTLLELEEWLAPLICFTPAQQEDFRERYLQWLMEKRLVDDEDLPDDPPPVKLPKPPPQSPRPLVHERIVRRVSKYKRPLVVSAAALAAAAALFIAYQLGAAYLKDEDLAQVVVLNPPVPQPKPVPTPFDDGGHDVVVVNNSPSTEPLAGLAWDVDKKTVEETPSPTPPTPPTPPPGFWVRNFPAAVALTLTMPFAGLGLWHFLRRRRRRREAERWCDERPRYDKIKVRGARERVFQSAALRPIARGLRHYLSVESRQLDARSTVRASVGRGGLFTPVYGTRRTLPEYLVLIDRVGFSDQLAQFYSDLVARLAERDVYLDTYYFHGDPRRCREGGADSPQLSLSDLAARHPDHFLLVFSDGTGLLSTTTGRPEPFVEQLLHWRGRALLTPVPRLEWEYREWALEREGLKVLPASLDGLRLLVEAVSTGARSVRAPDYDETPPYPDILREQPALWKERDAPPPNQTRRLVTHLRRYLGPSGFELLCACAVYPVMQWGVTLFLAYELLGRNKVEEVLPRLLRLPWFRNGTMPQWLRHVLVRELPRARRRFVRERLEHLLLAFLEDPERGLRPHFAEEQIATRTSLLTSISERLAVWRRSRQLRRRLEHAPARSPLAEPVFLNYITNNQRAEALPAPVRNKLFPRGVAAFGLRLAPAAALVLVAALTGLFLLLLERPTDDIYTPGAPADLLSHMLAPTPEPGQSTDPDFTYTPTTAKQGQTFALTLNAVTKGEYESDRMRLIPALPEDKFSLEVIDAVGAISDDHDPDSLSATVTIAPDAPPGPTELLLYDGDKLRARLPFTVIASGAPPPVGGSHTISQSPAPICPDIRIVQTGDFSRDPAGVLHAVVSGPGAGGNLTYTWSAGGEVSVVSGQGTSDVVMRYSSQRQEHTISGLVSVVVAGGGWPASCQASATYAYNNAPVAPQLGVSVEPQTITVCPSNPKLNDPPDSTVTVTVNTTMMVDVTVSDGNLKDAGTRRVVPAPTAYGGVRLANLYKWNLSGMSPSTYTVTAVPAAAAPTQPGAASGGITRTVTVKGCSADPPPQSASEAEVILNMAKAANNMALQLDAMTSVKRDLASNPKTLTPAEERAITGAMLSLNTTLKSLNAKLKSPGTLADANNIAALGAKVSEVGYALIELNGQVFKVKDDDARKRLLVNVNAMRSFFQTLQSFGGTRNP